MASNGRSARGPKRPAADGIAAAALANGSTRQEAARAAGLSERTIRRRLGDPDFRALVGDCRARIMADVLSGAAGLAGRAVERLGELVEDDNPHVALGACRAVLTVAADFGDRAELAERIEALERVLKARGAA